MNQHKQFQSPQENKNSSDSKGKKIKNQQHFHSPKTQKVSPGSGEDEPTDSNVNDNISLSNQSDTLSSPITGPTCTPNKEPSSKKQRSSNKEEGLSPDKITDESWGIPVIMEDTDAHITDDPQLQPNLFYPTPCVSESYRTIYRECLRLPINEWRSVHSTMIASWVPQLRLVKEIEAARVNETPLLQNTGTPQTTMRANLTRSEVVKPPRFPTDRELNPTLLRAFKNEVELYEQSGMFKFDRQSGISEEHQQTIQTLLNASKSEELIRLHWMDETKVTSPQWLNQLIKLAEGGCTGISDCELFRNSLQKHPLILDMWRPMATISQVGKMVSEFKLFDLSVTIPNEAERKNQIHALEKTLKFVNAGPEAKQDIASFSRI